MARVVNLGAERARRERRRRAALRRERERQATLRKVSSIALLFLRRIVELGHHNITLLFAIGPSRYRLSVERLDKSAPDPKPTSPA